MREARVEAVARHGASMSRSEIDPFDSSTPLCVTCFFSVVRLASPVQGNAVDRENGKSLVPGLAGLCIRMLVLPRGASATRVARFAVLALLCTLVLGAWTDRASAETSRPLLKTIKFPDNEYATQVATDAAGNVYATVRTNNAPTTGLIRKFDSEGNPVNFTAVAPYISGNAISATAEGDPIEVDGSFPAGIAVDKTGGPTDGYIYVTEYFAKGGGAVFAYKPSGEYAGYFDAFGFNLQCAVALDQTNGNVHVGDGFFTNSVRRYPATAEPTNNNPPNGSLNMPDPQNCALAVDLAGNL